MRLQNTSILNVNGTDLTDLLSILRFLRYVRLVPGLIITKMLAYFNHKPVERIVRHFFIALSNLKIAIIYFLFAQAYTMHDNNNANS